MKTFGLVVIIAAVTAGIILFLRKGSEVQTDHSELLSQLHDPNWTVRRTAANELAARQKPAAFRALLTATREEQPEVRVVIDRALQSARDPQTLEWLTTQGLKFPDRWTRYYAVKTVAARKGAQSVDLLLPLLGKNYWQVQLAILQAIEQNRTPAVTNAVAAVAGPGNHWQVRQEAIRHLGAANTADAARFLLTSAAPASDQDPDPTTEWAVEEALSSMSGPALDAIADEISRNPDPARRLLAIKAVGRAKHEPALAELKKAFSDKSTPQPARIAAIRAAIVAGRKAGADFGIDSLSSEEVPVRLEAAYALAEVDLDEPQITAIRELIAKEQNWRVRQALQIAIQPR
ncbi:MAG: HEAT repeat domain-containing protein [Planctomycetes bacterium]|nr:HEAT repeat domain-containing protein [Planctomycetota bacterium]